MGIEITSLHSQQLLPGIVLKMADSILEFGTVQKIQVLSHAGACLKSYPQWPAGSILDASTIVISF